MHSDRADDLFYCTRVSWHRRGRSPVSPEAQESDLRIRALFLSDCFRVYGTIHTDQGVTIHDDGDHLLQQVNSSITFIYFLFINAGLLIFGGVGDMCAVA
ncbi:hypothetical protein [Algoriphagus ratkowskyi]|uniref:Uncharacterized protein n=1 Tax=Algoriphagus ratkowskyi TaxID=57028 RepID=A0ABY3HMB7_9BACT|nr:hypothetical protein [Algoriphagus ratkowskyi]TXD77379.1 hypothetical protein ESW18_11265 [Algoriphagus ratkowskyi]